MNRDGKKARKESKDRKGRKGRGAKGGKGEAWWGKMTVVRIHASPQSGRTPDDPEGGSPELTVCAVRYHMRLSESS